MRCGSRIWERRVGLLGAVGLILLLGACRSEEARVQEARQLFDRARFQKAEQVLSPLFGNTDSLPDSVQLLYGKVLLAHGELRRARATYNRLLEEASAHRNEALHGLARAHFYLGHPDTARTVCRRLVHRGHRQDDPLRIAQGHHVMGRVHFYEAQYDSALVDQRASLRWARRAGDPKARADALRQIGVLYWYRGKIDSARTAFYEPALRLYRQVGDSIGVATTLSNLGFLHWQKHEWRAHARLQLQAFAMRKRMGHQIGVADSYAFLSSVPKKVGFRSPAFKIEYARKSLKLSRRIGYAWGEQVASGRLAKALRRGLKDWDRPLPSLTASSQPSGEYQMLRLMRASHTARHNDQWRRTDSLLALVSRIADSIGYYNFQRAPVVRRSQILLRLGREEEARALLQRADTLEKSGTRPWTNALEARVRARLALRNGRREAAAELLRPLAEQYDRRYLQALHRTAPEVAVQRAVSAVHGGRSKVYGGLLRVLVGRSPETTSSLRSGRIHDSRRDTSSFHSGRKDSKAFTVMERERGLPFWGGSQTEGQDREAFDTFIRQLERLEAAPGRTEEIQNLMTTLGELYNRKLAERRALDRTSPTTADLDVTTVSALKGVLQPEEVFVEYFVGRNTLFVFVARNDSSAFLTTSISNDRLSRTVNAYRQTVQRGHDHPQERLWYSSGQRLYELLLRPLARRDWIASGDHLVIAPHRMLYGVPVHALPGPATGDGPRFAVERYGVSYARSATALVERRERSAQRLASALVAAPMTRRLPHTAQEARRVPTAPFDERRVVTDNEARASVVRDGWSTYDLVHLAAHAQTNERFPLYSHLQLSDDRIALHEILRDSVRARLVVLSACETGRGVGATGGAPTSASLVSFPRAFLSAGARSVIASLWPVDDAATAHLMQHFYQQLTGAASGSSRAKPVSERTELTARPAQALNRAQRRYLREARRSDASTHPFYWAGFFLMGDGR